MAYKRDNIITKIRIRINNKLKWEKFFRVLCELCALCGENLLLVLVGKKYYC